jgi:hypothetical protein
MKKYIGTKMIKARPMTRAEYNKYRGWELPEDEDGDDKGFLVEYIDGGQPNHQNHKGYISWSPENVFNRAYRSISGMSFGLAIEAMKAGCKVARAGWNGKGMFVVYQKGYPDGIPCNKQTAEAFGINEGDLFKCRPYMQLKCSDGACQMWQPSVSDCLECDWEIV